MRADVCVEFKASPLARRSGRGPHGGVNLGHLGLPALLPIPKWKLPLTTILQGWGLILLTDSVSSTYKLLGWKTNGPTTMAGKSNQVS